MSLLRNNMPILVLLCVFIFLFFWQKSSFALLFLFPVFLVLFWEFFLFLKLKKNIIKEATLIKGSLFYRISMGNFCLFIFSFFLACFGIFSLFLNLLSLEKNDFIFVFVLLPLFLLFFKKKLILQFINNAYNDFRIIAIAGFFTALLYALWKLLFDYNELVNWEIFSQKIINYKSSYSIYLDILSQFLHFSISLKELAFSYFGFFGFKILNFFFDFFNFFVLCFILAYVLNFVVKMKNQFMVVILSTGIVFGNYFLKEQRNEEVKDYQKEILALMQNIAFLKDNNAIQKEKDNLQKDLKQLKDILHKNVFEISIWWFSKEKQDLEKRINESLK